MALELADRPVRPITVDEAMRMLDAGVFENAHRIELLHGVLTEKPVSSPEHVGVKVRLRRWLSEFDPEVLRLEDPLVAADGISMPQPDVAIVEPGDYDAAHPRTAHLVIEIAKTSFRLDTTVKPPLYAAMGIPEYWVVDLARRRVLVFRDPTPDGYDTQTTHAPPGTRSPLAVDIAPLDLSMLFDLSPR
jgi:Uma2 family endonuclease